MPRRRAGRLVSALRLRRGTHATPWSSLCARAVGLAPHDLEVTVRRRGPRSLVEHRHQRGGGRAGRLHRAKTAAAEELPDAVTVMDPFHVVRVPGDAPDTDLDGHDRVKSARCPALLVTCDDQPGRVAEQSSAQPSGHQQSLPEPGSGSLRAEGIDFSATVSPRSMNRTWSTRPRRMTSARKSANGDLNSE